MAGCPLVLSGRPPHRDRMGWEFTDDRGLTVRRAGRPERVVAYLRAGAGPWDLGVRPVGVYGSGHDGDEPDPAKSGSLTDVPYLGAGRTLDDAATHGPGPGGTGRQDALRRLDSRSPGPLPTPGPSEALTPCLRPLGGPQLSIARAARAWPRTRSAAGSSTAATISAYASSSVAPVRKSPRWTRSWARS